MTVHDLEAIFLANRDALLRFVRARGGGENAEDIVQDLWLRISRKEQAAVENPVAYLYRAANNMMLDHYRLNQRSRQRDNDWAEVNDRMSEDSAQPLPDRALVAREKLDEIHLRIAAQGERVLQIFQQFRIYGVSQRQIAKDFGISLSSVEKDLQKAYRALAEWRETDDADELER